MRIQTLAAGFAVAVLIPSSALAQQTCEQRQTNRAVGTIAGAGIGALLGSAVAGRGDRTAGAVVGGLGGAIVGNQVSKSKGDCTRAYGFYDNSGAWHASSVSRDRASGYFDREGAWIDGAPDGHYDRNGQWIRTSSEPQAAGYTDSRGRWVPASANGYYDTNGRWVTGVTSGHYDRSGRWIPGAATGRYDVNGRWMPGRPAGVNDPQPGYYDQGRWHRGEVRGYYDGRGRWVRVDVPASDNRQERSISSRQVWLDQRIHRGLNDGSLTRYEGDRALKTLASIGREERMLRQRNGDLRPRDEQMLQAKLDNLSESVRIMGRGPVRQY